MSSLFNKLKKYVPLRIRRLPNRISYDITSIFNQIIGRNLSDKHILSRYFQNSSTILYGPFKGIKYSHQAYCSSLVPKIIGTYEEQLYKFLPVKNEYQSIIDIGCAEGYYAIGLAHINPKSTVFAYDISREARKLCKKNCRINKINNLIIRGSFNLSEYRRVDGKKFIICDIEGFEQELLVSNFHKSYLDSDWLIELHEHIMPGTTNDIINKFRKTHEITLITDRKRVQREYEHLRSLKANIFTQCVDEHRDNNDMHWLFFKKVK